MVSNVYSLSSPGQKVLKFELEVLNGIKPILTKATKILEKGILMAL